MKIKKTSLVTVFVAVGLVTGVTTAFATSKQPAVVNRAESVTDERDGILPNERDGELLTAYIDPNDGKMYYLLDDGKTWAAAVSTAPATDTLAGIEHVVVLEKEIEKNGYMSGGFEVPAHTVLYLAQMDITSSVEMSVDCNSNVYYGISEQANGSGKHWNHQVTNCVTDHASICPDEPGSYYLYLANDTDYTITAGTVVMSEQEAQRRSYNALTGPRVYPIREAHATAPRIHIFFEIGHAI